MCASLAPPHPIHDADPTRAIHAMRLDAKCQSSICPLAVLRTKTSCGCPPVMLQFLVAFTAPPSKRALFCFGMLSPSKCLIIKDLHVFHKCGNLVRNLHAAEMLSCKCPGRVGCRECGRVAASCVWKPMKTGGERFRGLSSPPRSHSSQCNIEDVDNRGNGTG